MQYISKYQSPMGEMTLASDGEALTGAWFEAQKYFASTLNKDVTEREVPVLETVMEWLDRYFMGERPEIGELPLVPAGSEFRQSVWKILCEIPYGEVITYGDIARRIAEEKGIERMSSQAVGGAVGHNPISVIIPCHRVVGSNGSLTGYAGGIDLKVKLLQHENADMSKLFVPKKGTAL